MEPELRLYRIRFNRELEPIKVLLVHKKQVLAQNEWLAFIEQIKSSIINHPEQYFSKEIPRKDTLKGIVGSIFEEFVERVG